ncbi:hypothetical protein M431DRAFT_557412 [Trichoderma harzianum CBS 226.95]|uniref:Uncharacterized protein n=1 Tax=Trichoderma harzianum CBS 226.95 TaxID=983964 RepID=A0A2T4A6Z8_TRIHA|nr:hypothetical protein M431DRAFT_557412 [Trichoderma harzianum CBS 226.95]PTB52852.1 hypothetical protein M431DRAFT_557412 [Trichoderma harzianum CBS 226.95]
MLISQLTVRSAIAAAIPVANNQVFTVSLPGTIIDWKDYYYNSSKLIRPPLDIQVKEARLVDGMIPLSKFTAGKTGKSVARSYLAALDLLVPVEASVSGVIGNDTSVVKDERLKTIRDRYKLSMAYFTSPDDTPGSNGKSKVDTYVQKQSMWAKEVAAYAQAQAQAMERSQPPPGATTAQVREAKEKYMQWIQEHARETKYMDWVVHGYKFMVDFHFGVVDISSGMKRIENSKEAYRNLTVIAPDGSSEYNGVVLSPSSWATIVAKKVLNWKKNNSGPSPAEVRAEIRRLQNLLVSHKTLQKAVDGGVFFPVLASNKDADQSELQTAYTAVYANMDEENKKLFEKEGAPPAEADPNAAKGDSPLSVLEKAQKDYTEKSLSRTTATVRDIEGSNKDNVKGWLDARIGQLEADISDLKEQLGIAKAAEQAPAKLLPLPVVNENGIVITDEEARADPSIKNPSKPDIEDLDNEESWRNKTDDGPDPWTKISCKISAKSDTKVTATSQSASAVAAKAGWGFFSASGSASHSDSSSDAMQQMSNLDVEISMSCMVVEIERPWLHAELFADAELDSGSFEISPGEDALKAAFQNEKNLEGKYQQFSSFPTAFVVAADVELSFSGDTTKLESAVSASSTSANISVGYGPFALSGSHSSSKSKSRTKMDSTATGCKISVQAPQIVGWIQTLLPQLPKPKDGISTMKGLFA